jgi:hypothetical protein
MQNIQECGDGVASCFANLGLVDQSFVEEGSCVLLLLSVAGITASILALGLLTSGDTGDVEAHLDQLIAASGSLGAL